MLHGHARRQAAQEFSIGFDVDSSAFLRARFDSGGVFIRRKLAGNLGAADEVDAFHVPVAADEGSGDVLQVGVAAGGAAHDGAEIVAIEGGSGNEFAEDVSEEPDSHGEQFGELRRLFVARAVGIFDFEAGHVVGRPELPRLEVVGGHSAAFLEMGVEVVEEVGIDSNTGGDGEVAGGGFAMEIFVLDSAEGDAADSALPLDGHFRGGGGAEGNLQIVREGVGGAERENGEGDGSIGETLDNVVDGAIASAGEDGIAAVGDGAASVVGGFLAGAADGEFGADAGGLDDSDSVVELGVATAASRVGVKQNCRLAHAAEWPRFEFIVRRGRARRRGTRLTCE